jgi:hypothetical protein
VSGEIWGIVAYFNPVQYANKLQNLLWCSNRVRNQGLKLLVVELCFNDSPYVIPDNSADLVIRLRSTCVLWQKERLINIGVEKLPPICDKIVWLDADVAFEDPDWVRKTAKALEQASLVQPYSVAWWLPRDQQAIPDHMTANSFERIKHGFAFTHNAERSTPTLSGHPGFAWAAHRDILHRCGLYDRCIIGGADLAIAAAPFPDDHVAELREWLLRFCSVAQREDYVSWRNTFRKAVDTKISYVDGTVFHRWHGDQHDRSYAARHLMLKTANFNPWVDLTFDHDECWSWNSQKPSLHQAVAAYFRNRNEDSNLLEMCSAAGTPGNEIKSIIF